MTILGSDTQASFESKWFRTASAPQFSSSYIIALAFHFVYQILLIVTSQKAHIAMCNQHETALALSASLCYLCVITL